MPTQKRTPVPAEALAAARQRAAQTRRELKNKPGPKELLTAQELAGAAPFYFVLRNYIQQLKAAREAAGLTLADVAARSGLAVESLSRLETGAQTNPTWKTLGTYAKALGLPLQLTLQRETRPEVQVAEKAPGPSPRRRKSRR
jgi:DNA-binding XRE family transcriptional regulator